MVEHKSEQILQTAVANGWKAQLIPDVPLDGNVDDIVWNLYCVRDRESMHVQYRGSRFELAVYTFSNQTSYPQYRNNVLKILTGRPSIRKIKQTGTDNIEEARSVPWVSDDPAFLILQEVLGKEIAWVRQIDGVVCKGTVDRHSNLGNKYFRIYEKNSIRFLEWTNVEGFHAVRLDAIISVS